MAKVIATDNFDRDHISDKLIKSGLTMLQAIRLADELNGKCHDDSQWYYRAVEDSYKLYNLAQYEE